MPTGPNYHGQGFEPSTLFMPKSMSVFSGMKNVPSFSTYGAPLHVQHRPQEPFGSDRSHVLLPQAFALVDVAAAWA